MACARTSGEYNRMGRDQRRGKKPHNFCKQFRFISRFSEGHQYCVKQRHDTESDLSFRKLQPGLSWQSSG